ncbi:MAG: DUF2470 domain-containing protein [Alphaproteobacteria bacterium]|nr:DUF2470 domain-containing protein [Alphaproteobacteria bacterium]
MAPDIPLDRPARHLVRRCPTAALATIAAGAEAGPGSPYASLVLTACLPNGAPILLLSRLAEHTRNFAADPRVSLLFDGTTGLKSRLTGTRLSMQGRIERCGGEAAIARRRFLARHGDAASYADFGDFAFYRVHATSAHLVAGFGKIHWIDGNLMRFDAEGYGAVIDAEPDICTHMNDDHAAGIDALAAQLGGRGTGWRITGCDPEGYDLAREGEHFRGDFPSPVRTLEAVRTTFIALIRRTAA